MCSGGTVTRGKPRGMARAETAAALRAAWRRVVLETILGVWSRVEGWMDGSYARRRRAF